MSGALKTEDLTEAVDPILDKAKSLTGKHSEWQKALPICNDTLTGKKAFFYSHIRPGEYDASIGGDHVFYGGSDYSRQHHLGQYVMPDVESCPQHPVTDISSAALIAGKVSPVLTGCVRLVDMMSALDIVEMMEAKPKAQAKKVDASRITALREVRSAPELYADLDLDRIKERAAELRAASSDSAAISMVLGRSVQIVVHDE